MNDVAKGEFARRVFGTRNASEVPDWCVRAFDLFSEAQYQLHSDKEAARQYWPVILFMAKEIKRLEERIAALEPKAAQEVVVPLVSRPIPVERKMGAAKTVGV